MKHLFYLLIFCFVFLSCKQDNNTKATTNTTQVGHEKTILTLTPQQRSDLKKELQDMYEADQAILAKYIAASGDEKKKVGKEKKAVVSKNTKKVKELFYKYGFLGYDIVGEEGSRNFWLLVQNIDDDIDFQFDVLKKMGPAVEKGNAFAPSYAYLTDIVRLKAGRTQIYGTQVNYNDRGQAIPKPLVDSLNVNKRRANIAMKSIELYLNSMTEKHFNVNKEIYKAKGINRPILYDVK